MVAKRYLLRLDQHGSQRREWEDNVDPADEGRLRELLDEGVGAAAGSMRLDLSDGWRLTVHALPNMRWVARVTVDSSGRTKVQR